MNIYIINASARAHGYCAQAAGIIRDIAEAAGASVQLDRTVSLKIGFCRACDSCKGTEKCVIADDMQSVYGKLLAADAIFVVTPVQFNTVPASLKCLLDRCQLFYNNREVERTQKRAYTIAIGGARSYDGQFTGIFSSQEHFLKYLNAEPSGSVLLSGSDHFDGSLPETAVSQIEALVKALLD